MKISSTKWLVTYDYNSDSHKESETLSPLPRFKRIRKVNISNAYIYCSCKYRTRYGIDCPHVYHVVSQSKEFDEPSHHEVSVCWWNIYYQISCLSADNQEFDELEKAMKILQLNKKDGLPVQIHNEKNVPDEFKKEKYSYCMNYPLIKVEYKILQQFKSHPFASTFT